jgi:hypothetical protein
LAFWSSDCLETEKQTLLSVTDTAATPRRDVAWQLMLERQMPAPMAMLANLVVVTVRYADECFLMVSVTKEDW